MSNLYNDPSWANGGAIVLPTAAKRLAGWVGNGEKPPYQTMNAIQNAQGNWCSNLGSVATRYDSLDDFAFYADEGDLGFVLPDYSYAPWAQRAVSNRGGTATSVTHVDVGGVYVDPAIEPGNAGSSVRWFVAVVTRSGTDTVEILRYDGSLIGSALSLSSAPTTITSARTNGTLVAVTYDDQVDLFDCSDPTSPSLVYNTTIGPSVLDCAITQDALYVVRGTGSGDEVYAISLTSALTLWSAPHGATLNAIRSDGVRVWVAGNAGTSGATVRAYDASTGGTLWSNATPGATPGNETVACDGRILYVADNTNLYVIDAINGNDIATNTDGADALAIHPRWLINGGGSGASSIAYYLDRPNVDNDLDFIPGVAPGATIKSVATDGEVIVVGHDVVSSNVITIYAMPNITPSMFRAQKSTDTFQPYNMLHFPISLL